MSAITALQFQSGILEGAGYTLQGVDDNNTANLEIPYIFDISGQGELIMSKDLVESDSAAANFHLVWQVQHAYGLSYGVNQLRADVSGSAHTATGDGDVNGTAGDVSYNRLPVALDAQLFRNNIFYGDTDASGSLNMFWLRCAANDAQKCDPKGVRPYDGELSGTQPGDQTYQDLSVYGSNQDGEDSIASTGSTQARKVDAEKSNIDGNILTVISRALNQIVYDGSYCFLGAHAGATDKSGITEESTTQYDSGLADGAGLTTNGLGIPGPSGNIIITGVCNGNVHAASADANAIPLVEDETNMADAKVRGLRDAITKVLATHLFGNSSATLFMTGEEKVLPSDQLGLVYQACRNANTFAPRNWPNNAATTDGSGGYGVLDAEAIMGTGGIGDGFVGGGGDNSAATAANSGSDLSNNRGLQVAMGLDYDAANNKFVGPDDATVTDADKLILKRGGVPRDSGKASPMLSTFLQQILQQHPQRFDISGLPIGSSLNTHTGTNAGAKVNATLAGDGSGDGEYITYAPLVNHHYAVVDGSGDTHYPKTYLRPFPVRSGDTLTVWLRVKTKLSIVNPVVEAMQTSDANVLDSGGNLEGHIADEATNYPAYPAMADSTTAVSSFFPNSDNGNGADYCWMGEANAADTDYKQGGTNEKDTNVCDLHVWKLVIVL